MEVDVKIVADASGWPRLDVAIPLLSLGGGAVTDLTIAEQTGCLVAHGNVQ